MKGIYHKFYWIFIAFLILVIVGGIFYSHHTKPPDVITHKMNVSPKVEKQIEKEIIIQRQPVERYYAPTVKAVEKHETENKKTDKVIISPSDDNKRVDVYRITLKREHKIKTGVTIMDNHVYPAVGYQAGKFEGIATMNGNHLKSATVMYTIKEW